MKKVVGKEEFKRATTRTSRFALTLPAGEPIDSGDIQKCAAIASGGGKTCTGTNRNFVPLNPSEPFNPVVNESLLDDVIRIACPHGYRTKVVKLSFRQKLGKYFPAMFLTKEERLSREVIRIAGFKKNKKTLINKISDFLFRDREHIQFDLRLEDIKDKDVPYDNQPYAERLEGLDEVDMIGSDDFENSNELKKD